MKMKKRLTQSEEFEIMKLVLDKFLWLGIVVMGFGLYKMLTDLLTGIAWLVVGIIILLLFMVVIVKEYEVIS